MSWILLMQVSALPELYVRVLVVAAAANAWQLACRALVQLAAGVAQRDAT
jgi:hypothetical protein